MEKRNLRKERIGIVTSDKMDKSIVVAEVKKNIPSTESSLRTLQNLLLMMKRMIAMREIQLE